MPTFRRLLLLACVSSAFGSAIHPDAQAQTPTTLERALDRAVLRVTARPDLQNHRGGGFDRDSFDVEAFRGLGKAEDSTVIGWFTGFSTYINGTDSSACHDLITGEPTGSMLARQHSVMDSAAVELWVTHWENAVVASFLAPERPPANEEDMMVALFALLAKLPEAEMGFSRKPSDKPRKMSSEAECRTMRQFFTQALQMEEPTKMTLLRGLAQIMNEKPDLTVVEEQ
jgi:hypothetical protein